MMMKGCVVKSRILRVAENIFMIFLEKVILVRTHFNLIEIAYIRLVYHEYHELSDHLKSLAVFSFF